MFTVGIIGAGSIGALKPDNIDGPNLSIPLTHASAITKNENLDLTWIYDNSTPIFEQATKKWNLDKSKCFDAVDILVVSTPTETHLQKIEDILFDYSKDVNHKLKLIVLEKPCGININEATRIDYLSKQHGIPVFVNYGRRYIQGIRNIFSCIKEQEKIQCIHFYYTRGLVRDGSHVIDILNMLCGSFIDGNLLPNPIIDYSENDPTYGVILSYSECENIFITPINSANYDVFEMVVMTDRSRWEFLDHFKSVRWTQKKKESTYGNYYSMPAGCNSLWKTDLEYSLKYLYEDIVSYLNSDPENRMITCGMKEALRVHSIIDRLLIKKSIEDRENNK